MHHDQSVDENLQVGFKEAGVSNKERREEVPEVGEEAGRFSESVTKRVSRNDADKVRSGKEVDSRGDRSTCHKILSYVGKEIGQFLGLRDDYTMLLWKENFLNRKRAGDFGINFRTSVMCARKGVKSPMPGSECAFEHHLEPEKKLSMRYGYPVPDISKRRPSIEVSASSTSLLAAVMSTQSNAVVSQTKMGADAIKAYKKIVKMECQLSRQPKRLDEILALAPELPPDLPEEEVIRREGEFMQSIKMLTRHRPHFIWIVSVIQLAAMFGVLIAGDGIAPIGLIPQLVFKDRIQTMRGRESIERWELPNPWIGPDIATFVASGVVFSTCMRRDKGIEELETFFKEGDVMGCCRHELRRIMGTTNQAECNRISNNAANWTADELCPVEGERGMVMLRPCCFGLLGNCKLATKNHCQHLNGIYHISAEVQHCSQVKCLQSVCMTRTSDYPYQWSRMFTSIAFHPGILFCLPVIVIQWLVGTGLEASIGSYRMAIIYVVSAAGANVVGATFNPYLPQMGGSGAVFGLLGLSTFEVAQARLGPRGKLIRCLTKLAVAATVLMVFGTFPLADNFQHVFGLVFCLLTAITICPHLSFNYWDVRSRRIVFGVASGLLVTVIIATLVIFFIIQDTHFCPYCSDFSCIPYTEGMCSFAEHVIGTSHSV